MNDLKCPECHGELEKVGDKLQCMKCGQQWWELWQLNKMVKADE